MNYFSNLIAFIGHLLRHVIHFNLEQTVACASYGYIQNRKINNDDEVSGSNNANGHFTQTDLVRETCSDETESVSGMSLNSITSWNTHLGEATASLHKIGLRTMDLDELAFSISSSNK